MYENIYIYIYIYIYYVMGCNIIKSNNFLKYYLFFLKKISTNIYIFYLFISTKYKYIILLYFVCLINIFFKVNYIFLTSVVLYYILYITKFFKFQISHLLRNNEIIIIIKIHHKITMLLWGPKLELLCWA